MRVPELSYLTDVHFGRGAVAALPEVLAHLGVREPLVVTDPTLRAMGLVEHAGLDRAAVFDATATNPDEDGLDACVASYRAAGCDGIVALGGGAAIDLAKLAGLMLSHPPPLEQYAILRGGAARMTRTPPPLVAVPTTAGSGSEVGRAALLRLRAGRKLGFLGAPLVPKAAICDPVLTATMPPALTAATGMDAISHCIETYCSPRFNPVADAIALDGLARGFGAIRRAFADGADLDAREEMALCALMGGLAFQKGLGAVHSLSHPLGALAGLALHHGTLNALFLAPVLRFNATSCPERMQGLARALGLVAAEDVPEACAQLVAALALPRRLRDLGVPAAALAPLAPQAAEDHCSATNPRRFDAAAARLLYEESW